MFSFSRQASTPTFVSPTPVVHRRPRFYSSFTFASSTCRSSTTPVPPSSSSSPHRRASFKRTSTTSVFSHHSGQPPQSDLRSAHDSSTHTSSKPLAALLATLITAVLPLLPANACTNGRTDSDLLPPTDVNAREARRSTLFSSSSSVHRPLAVVTPLKVSIASAGSLSANPSPEAVAEPVGPIAQQPQQSSSSSGLLTTRQVNFLRQRLNSLREAIEHILHRDAHGHGHGDDHSGHGAATNDALVLLLTTVIIIPLTRRFGISPILGFLAAGIFLGPNGFALIRDVRTSKALAELGVVFFLFEMGLELSTSKLKSLGGDVFGLGTAQFLVTGVIISGVAALTGMASQTAIVLGAGLALSSSAFVLQLLSERGEVGTRFGRAAFGILLFQDLAVVPVLVLTPLLAGSGGAAAVGRAISIASVKAAAALAFIFFMGKNFLQPAFRFVARSKSTEAFIAAILFAVLATSSLTQVLGLSDTLGAFLAGVMLAETKFRHQIEADIKPFRGLLLGLFFITVGFSIDLNLAFAKLGAVTAMVSGLLFVKTSVIAVAAVAFGLSLGSALRTGLLLSQGGEFAFVIYGLAMRVGVMPTDMGQLMLLVVAISMAVTPALAELGRRISMSLERKRGLIGVRMEDADTADARDFVMVAGWGRVGQSVCEMLDAKLVRYMAFDMSPTRVIDARNKGLPVFFGDARRPEVLRSAGVERARAVVVTLDDPDQALDAVLNIVREFEGIQVFCRARDSKHQKLLQAAGATAIVPELLEASLLLGGAVLLDYGTPIEEVNALIEEARAANVEEVGISESITATLTSSFKQLVKLDDDEVGTAAVTGGSGTGSAGNGTAVQVQKEKVTDFAEDEDEYEYAEDKSYISGDMGETTFDKAIVDSPGSLATADINESAFDFEDDDEDDESTKTSKSSRGDSPKTKNGSNNGSSVLSVDSSSTGSTKPPGQNVNSSDPEADSVRSVR